LGIIKIFYTMGITSQTIKDCRKAVNQASFSPTAQRKARALKLLAELTKEVTDLKTLKVKPKAKPKAKATPKVKAKAKSKDAPKVTNDEKLATLTKAELVALLSAMPTA
tara:strand:+ start:302 stop:628 length:327 start_codon:yes stop_codon:yes gene_type:complete